MWAKLYKGWRNQDKIMKDGFAPMGISDPFRRLEILSVLQAVIRTLKMVQE